MELACLGFELTGFSLPEVDTGSSYALLAMGIIYGAGFLIGAWLLVRRLSRKEQQFHENEQTSKQPNSDESEDRLY